MKGWLISASPGTRDGARPPWYASFWEFCARYSGERFAGDWHLSPAQSILLHAENTVIPSQVVIYSPSGANNVTRLSGTSIYDLKLTQMPPAADLTMRDGLRLFSPPAAMVRVPEAFFASNPIETQAVLARIRDSSDLLRCLLEGGRAVVAGRLAGAFRRVGRPEAADEILIAMKSAGYAVRESDPFVGP